MSDLRTLRQIALTLSLATATTLAGCGNKSAPPAGAAETKPTARVERAGFGAEQPKVDVLAFVGYQCPHCKMSAATLVGAFEAHKDIARVRLVNLPLDAHPDSVALAEAAVAARRMGLWRKFWDHAFEAEKVDAGVIESFAKLEGVDAAQFEKLRKSAEVREEVSADVALAAVLGVAGTPSYLVNGALLQGAQDAATWEGIFKTQAGVAAELLEKGTKPTDLLQALVERNSPKRAPFYVKHVLQGEAAPKVAVPAKTQRTSGVVGATIQPAGGGAGAMPVGQRLQFGQDPRAQQVTWRVLVRSDDPIRGAVNAPVTIVVFGDFECPHSKSLQATLDAVRQKFGDKVRIVWKHNPQAIHQHAMLAAKAAEAARAQGKFWEMHDQLFGAPTLTVEGIGALAAAAGLDIDRFRNAMAATGADERIRGDLEQVEALAVRGTPNLYVNGQLIVGAPDVEKLTATVDAELAKANALIEAGTPAGEVYEKTVGEGKLLDSLAPTAVKIDTSLGITRGPEAAAIHIVTFQDLQCPFCARLEPHIAEVMAEFDGRVKVTWMDFPLPFHPNAKEAAEAGRIAAKAGKFWNFRDLVVSQQDRMARADLVGFAARLGLDAKAFEKDLTAGTYAGVVAKSAAEAERLGLKGTPSVFINGHAFTPQLGFSAATFRAAIRRLIRARE
ncbi:MAG: thioredoxin domain-containing protein [Deltaproteobacteria bacterium]|nr:thioredoxin domain-containing protein [Deltaproteobacteria bacterium]